MHIGNPSPACPIAVNSSREHESLLRSSQWVFWVARCAAYSLLLVFSHACGGSQSRSRSPSTDVSDAVMQWLKDKKAGCILRSHCRYETAQAFEEESVDACELATRRARRKLAESIRVRVRLTAEDESAVVNDHFYSTIRHHLEVSTDVILEDSKSECQPGRDGLVYSFVKFDLEPKISKLTLLAKDMQARMGKSIAMSEGTSSLSAIYHLRNAVLYGARGESYRLQLDEVAAARSLALLDIASSMTDAAHALEERARDCSVEAIQSDFRWVKPGNSIEVHVWCKDQRLQQKIPASGFVVQWSSPQFPSLPHVFSTTVRADSQGVARIKLPSRLPRSIHQGKLIINIAIDWLKTLSRGPEMIMISQTEQNAAHLRTLAAELPRIEKQLNLYSRGGGDLVDFLRASLCPVGFMLPPVYLNLEAKGAGFTVTPQLEAYIQGELQQKTQSLGCRRIVWSGKSNRTEGEMLLVKALISSPLNEQVTLVFEIDGDSLSVEPNGPTTNGPTTIRISEPRSLCLVSCAATLWSQASTRCADIFRHDEASAVCLLKSLVYVRQYPQARRVLSQFQSHETLMSKAQVVGWGGIILQRLKEPGAWHSLDRVRHSEVMRNNALYWLNMALADLQRAQTQVGTDIDREHACTAFRRFIELEPNHSKEIENRMRAFKCEPF